ncbi:MAG: hypothetical protein A2W34_07385 [Chloroflexi bacterium RBG_16_64_32]|nr:MAG: hypothetical protein A2W34_07385 [Chloroflexi bacterium RBG_16_64_32]
MRGDIALFLGLVAVIGGGIVVAVIFLLGGNGGGNNACDNALPPLGRSDISQAGFQAEDAGLAKVIQAASAGNLPAAEDAFFGDVHGFTHNVDPPLRPIDEEMARDLCESVIHIEEELAIDRRVDVIASDAARIRALLRDAAEALGYARPGD